MPFALTMPKLSPTMEGGTLVRWYKKEGEYVKSGETLFEVATDKATVEYDAIDEGFLHTIVIEEGKEALVGEDVAFFADAQDEDLSAFIQSRKKVAVEKATTTIKEEQEEEKLEKSSAVGNNQSPSFSLPHFPIESPLDRQEDVLEEFPRHIHASPLAKKYAKENGIDLLSVKGSGPGGRIMRADLDTGQKIEGFLRFGKGKNPVANPGSYSRQGLSPMRKAIGLKLQGSKMSVPHFYVQQDIDIAPVLRLKQELLLGGLKVTLNDCIMKATSFALRAHPNINCGYDQQTNEIVFFHTVDIAVAVSLPSGLITPIVRCVDHKSLGQIGSEVKALAKRAKDGALMPEEYRGGSFTVSNLGMFGIDHFQAIINPPQVAILAIGGSRDCPVIEEGKVVPGKRMMVSLSSDHRVIDGADAARFLQSVKNYLERPSLLLTTPV